MIAAIFGKDERASVKDFRFVILAVVISVLISLSFVKMQGAGNKETRLDQIRRTGVLRCGYVIYEPFIIKDPNTGKLSGLTVDYLNEVAARQGYSVEWTGEVNFDQIVPSLDGGRFDMVCVQATPNTDFERVLSFVGDLGGMPYYTYVKADSALTEQTLPTAQFVLHDGFALSEITRNAYPKAQFNSLTQNASMAEFFDQLKYGKVDAAVNEHIAAEHYMKANPGIIRRVSEKPVIAMRMFFIAAKNDAPMSDFITQKLGFADPANLAIMKRMMVKYHVPDDALLLGEACKPALTEKGWKICAP